MSRGGRHLPYPGPRRTCLGCRAVRPPAELVRVGLCDGQVTTLTRASRGRSAYFCPAKDCATKAVRHLARALRVEPGTLKGVDLWRTLQQRGPIDPPQMKV